MASEQECPICYEKMSQPKMLPCRHKFCLDCLKRTIDPEQDQNIVKCALCRQKHKLPKNGIKNFPSKISGPSSQCKYFYILHCINLFIVLILLCLIIILYFV